MKIFMRIENGGQIVLPTKSVSVKAQAVPVTVVGFVHQMYKNATTITREEQIGRKIAAFINVPFIDKGVPMAAEIVQEGCGLFPRA